MKKTNSSVEANLGILENQLDESLLEIEWLIKERAHIKDPDSLYEAEQRIGEATNRLAACILALKIQENLDKQELRDNQIQIIGSVPKKPKKPNTPTQ
ncbi:MAG: hypothetical protein D3903_11070, partial [Candidatus Electrothrix sp. GM3_4]|nr:hypothetical protein [Candidatus Electrothrix sp. GM3_4]